MGEAFIVRRGGGVPYAIIGVTYPEGSVCTCTDGTRTLTAKDTTGKAMFIIPSAGTWTVKAVKGSKSKSKAVSITAEGQVETVELAHDYVIFSNETGLDPIYSSGSHVKITVETDSSGQKVLVFGWDGGDYPYDVAYLTPAIDLTDYKTLKISGYSATGERHFSVWSRVPQTYNYDEVASVNMLTGSTPSSYTIDVSSLSGNYYIGGGTPSNGTKIYAYDLRLE